MSAIVVWGAWRIVKTSEDPRRLRRSMICLGAFYIFAAINGIVEVVRGRVPLRALIGLPIGLTFAWWYLKTASRIKLQPK